MEPSGGVLELTAPVTTTMPRCQVAFKGAECDKLVSFQLIVSSFFLTRLYVYLGDSMPQCC
jgi:hypothetical protein